MPPETILIKKYENRRLYNTVDSRYINLEDVAKLLQAGHHVRVVDAASDEDITRLILTQIIVEDAKSPDSKMPISVLRDMAVATGLASQERAFKYMKSMMELYQETYRVIAPPLAPFDFLRGREPAARPPAAPPVPAAVEDPRAVGDVDELKQRVAELEALVGRLAPAKASRRQGKARG